MKKILLFAIGLFSIAAVSAQVQQAPVQLKTIVPSSEATYQTVNHTTNNNAQFRGGDEFFCEDFSNGYDGNNPYGAWTTFDDAALGDVWENGGPGLSNGQYSSEAALASTTGSNGYALFDADGYNTDNDLYAGGLPPGITGYLTSPIIDMSLLNSAVVSWEQFFRYCCFDMSPITLEVTVDGGSSWTLFAAHGDFTPDANVGSVNGQEVSIDISCVAAGQSEVQIRFAYNSSLADIYNDFGASYSVYFWAIDDVCISANPNADDIAINQVVNGDIFEIWEYYATPMDQAVTAGNGGLLVGTIFENAGTTDISAATLTIEILDETQANVLNTTVVEDVTILSPTNPSVCPSMEDTMYVSTGWVPSEIGTYWIRSTMNNGEVVDATEDNNTMMKKIIYTEDQYGHDDRDAIDFELRPPSAEGGIYEPHGWGNFYTFPNEGSSAYGVNVMFGTHCNDGFDVQVRLYTVDGALATSDYEEFFFFIDEDMIPSNSADMLTVHLEFGDEVEMDSEAIYFVGIMLADEGEEDMTIRAEEFIDTDFSSRMFQVTDDENWFSLGAIPSVRLVLGSHIPIDDSVDELAAANGITIFQNMPNPANDMTVVNYKLEESKEISFEIHDITGKLVQTINQGTQASGSHLITFDLKNMADGIYNYTMIADGIRITKKMVVGK